MSEYEVRGNTPSTLTPARWQEGDAGAPSCGCPGGLSPERLVSWPDGFLRRPGRRAAPAGSSPAVSLLCIFRNEGSMSKARQLVTLISIAALAFDATAFGSDGQTVASRFYGVVGSGSASIPAGTAVSAWVGESQLAAGTIFAAD